MKALVLIDIQNDFLPGGTLAVPRGDEILPILNRIQAHFDLIVATADVHPAGHCSFASNHAGKEPFEMLDEAGATRRLWPDHCVQGTRGAELALALNAEKIECVFEKGTLGDTDSYSGFLDERGQVASGLAEYLQSKNVTDLFIAGLATDYCVKATAMDAVRLGFRTFVIADACRGVDQSPGDVTKAFAEMRQAGIDVIMSADLEDEHLLQSLTCPTTVSADGRFVRYLRRGKWEFVERANASGVVIIVPITHKNEYVFVEQYRVPVRGRCIEFPAGLAGDLPGQETEAFASAARRELLEETGFEASKITPLGSAVSSAGLASESVTFFKAHPLTRTTDGGGAGSEKIVVHVVHAKKVLTWLREKERAGYVIAAKLYAGLWLAEMVIEE